MEKCLRLETNNFSDFVPGGGGNYHICRYGMCRFFGVPFFERKRNFGVSCLVKSQLVINFGVSFKKNNFSGY